MSDEHIRALERAATDDPTVQLRLRRELARVGQDPIAHLARTLLDVFLSKLAPDSCALLCVGCKNAPMCHAEFTVTWASWEERYRALRMPVTPTPFTVEMFASYRQHHRPGERRRYPACPSCVYVFQQRYVFPTRGIHDVPPRRLAPERFDGGVVNHFSIRYISPRSPRPALR